MPETDCKYAGPSTGRVLTVGLTARSVRGRLFGMIVFGVPPDATIRSNRTAPPMRASPDATPSPAPGIDVIPNAGEGVAPRNSRIEETVWLERMVASGDAPSTIIP